MKQMNRLSVQLIKASVSRKGEHDSRRDVYRDRSRYIQSLNGRVVCRLRTSYEYLISLLIREAIV